MHRLCPVSRKTLTSVVVGLLLRVACVVLGCAIVCPVQGWAQWRQLRASPAADTANLSLPPSLSAAGKSLAGSAELPGLPADAQGPVSAALGKDDSGYWVHRTDKGFRAQNPRQALVAEFTRLGVEVRSHGLRWGLETRGLGYGDTVHPINAVATEAKANRVEYRRDGVTEWYENGPLGLEQGFTLAHPPGKANGQAVAIVLALRGDLVAVLEPAGLGNKSKALELRTKDGKAVLRYTGLKARDATGRELRTWLEINGQRLLVRMEDGDARYPVVLDPSIQQAELTSSDGEALDEFGWSVAVSGSTVVVGAPSYHVTPCNQEACNGGPGAAYVFVQSGSTWTQQAELMASDGVAGDDFGYSVAVSGGTAVVGAPYHTANSQRQGATYLFVQDGTTWSQQAELMASDAVPGDSFGYSVAVSGSTAVVGAVCHPNLGSSGCGPGAAYLFVQSGTTWLQQAELIASDGVPSDSFGDSVAVDGSTAVVGADCHPYAVSTGCGGGAAYVFVQNGETWSQQAELAGPAPNSNFGYSVAISGASVVVGAPTWGNNLSNYLQGLAWVYVQNGSVWNQQQVLGGSDTAPGDEFGYSVAISGSTAVVSAPFHNPSPGPYGAAYVFTPSGTTPATCNPAFYYCPAWIQAAELAPPDANGPFGTSVAVTGNTVLVGDFNGTVGASGFSQGAAYVFGFVPTSITLTSSVNPSVVGQSVTFTATVTGQSPTGTVRFTQNGSNLSGLVPLSNGQATYTTAFPGTEMPAMGAKYSGDGYNLPSTSAALNQNVVQAVVTLSGSPQQPLTTDGSGNFVAQVTITNTGNVTISSVLVTAATLGSGSLISTPVAITNLAPGASTVVTLTFPSNSAPPGATTAPLKLGGTYSVTSPALSGNWALSFRRVTL